MGARTTAYAETTGFSTLSTTLVDVLSLTFTPADNSTYLLWLTWDAGHDNQSPTFALVQTAPSVSTIVSGVTSIGTGDRVP